jgi:hypothetical protein
MRSSLQRQIAAPDSGARWRKGLQNMRQNEDYYEYKKDFHFYKISSDFVIRHHSTVRFFRLSELHDTQTPKQ